MCASFHSLCKSYNVYVRISTHVCSYASIIPTTASKHLSTMATTRSPLSVEERRIVYEYLNSWIQEYGLDAFNAKKWTKDKCIFLANTINAVNAANEASVAPRSALGVKMQIKQLYEGRLSPLAKLRKRSEYMKMLLELGRAISHEDRYPKMAIPIPTVANGMYMSKDSEKITEKRKLKEVQGAVEISEMTVAKRQRKEQIIKLSVNWARLRVGQDGSMSVS